MEDTMMICVPHWQTAAILVLHEILQLAYFSPYSSFIGCALFRLVRNKDALSTHCSHLQFALWYIAKPTK
jgi:hypothetical protein